MAQTNIKAVITAEDRASATLKSLVIMPIMLEIRLLQA